MYVAEFQTNNSSSDCKVVAWTMIDIEGGEVLKGDNIIDFMYEARRLSPCKIWFENLKFSGGFILDYLLNIKAKFTESSSLKENEFRATISDSGAFYNINWCSYISKTHKKHYVEFADADKLIPVDELADFGYEGSKLEQLGKALDFIVNEQGFDRPTIGANAMAMYKKTVDFGALFQIHEKADTYIRKAYGGGWVFLNSKKPVSIDDGIVLDINSMFPFVMRTKLLPYGKPTFCYGKCEASETYPLFIQRMKCCFSLKKGKLPTIRVRKDARYDCREFMTDSGYEPIELTLTNVDLEVFFENYTVYNIEYLDGVMFRGRHGMFDDYIDYWMQVKIEATLSGNKALRKLAKLMLNSLYGKFSTLPTRKGLIPKFDGEKVVYETSEERKTDPVYIPMGCFITAYARAIIVTEAGKCGKRFVYADTDSLHLRGTEIPAGLEVDPTKLGAWKLESTIKRGKYLHAKCYCEELTEDGETFSVKTVVAGLPTELHSQISFEDFAYGATYTNKMVPATVKGGVIMKPTIFTIKKEAVV